MTTDSTTSLNTRVTTQHGVQFDLAVEKAEFNQYWYSQQTIRTLLDEVRHHATSCAFLSTPSLYFSLLDDASDSTLPLTSQSRLFEFDRQWEKDTGFVFYDFHKPDHVPVQYLGAFDYVLADPPFITADVWAAYIHTAKLLLKTGGKLLFTTVMENHTMLEGFIDGPLFIAPFRPSITHLTYQYVCFTNYKATRLTHVNDELPPEDVKIVAAVQMANDLRESEKAFTAQMQQRNRTGEQLLPIAKHPHEPETGKEKPMEDLPIHAMRWGFIPDGLTMYANGNEAPPSTGEETCDATSAIDYGDTYRDLITLRESLERFKRDIDLAQRLLDQLLKRALSHTKEAAEERGDEETRRKFAATLDEMRALIAVAESSETRLAETTATASAASMAHGYMAAMRECVSAYAVVPLRKQELSELAADATRRFKSPVFNRMKELLQWIKEVKRQHTTPKPTTQA